MGTDPGQAKPDGGLHSLLNVAGAQFAASSLGSVADWQAWLANGMPNLPVAGPRPAAASQDSHGGQQHDSEAVSKPSNDHMMSDAEAAAGLLCLLQAASGAPKQPKPRQCSLSSTSALPDPATLAGEAAAAAGHHSNHQQQQQHNADQFGGIQGFLHPLLQHYNNNRGGPRTSAFAAAAGLGPLDSMGLGEDGDISPETSEPAAGSKGNSGGGGSTSFARIKEKNRLAQQRFRQKQKNMVAGLKTRLAELEDMAGRQAQEFEATQAENALLRRVVADQQNMLRAALSRSLSTAAAPTGSGPPPMPVPATAGPANTAAANSAGPTLLELAVGMPGIATAAATAAGLDMQGSTQLLSNGHGTSDAAWPSQQQQQKTQSLLDLQAAISNLEFKTALVNSSGSGKLGAAVGATGLVGVNLPAAVASEVANSGELAQQSAFLLAAAAASVPEAAAVEANGSADGISRAASKDMQSLYGTGYHQKQQRQGSDAQKRVNAADEGATQRALKRTKSSSEAQEQHGGANTSSEDATAEAPVQVKAEDVAACAQQQQHDDDKQHSQQQQAQQGQEQKQQGQQQGRQQGLSQNASLNAAAALLTQQPQLCKAMLQLLQQAAAKTGMGNADAVEGAASAAVNEPGAVSQPQQQQQPPADVQAAMQQLLQWCGGLPQAGTPQ